MGLHTFTGWISFAAVMTSSAATGFTATKLILDSWKGRLGDRQDVVMAGTFATLTLLAGLLFLFAEGRP